MKYYQISNSGFEVNEGKALCALNGTTPKGISYIFVGGKATHCTTQNPVLLMRASVFLHQMDNNFYNTGLCPTDQDLVVLIDDKYSAKDFFEDDERKCYKVGQVRELRNNYTEFLKLRDDNNIPTRSELDNKYGGILSRAFSYSTLPWVSGVDGYISQEEFNELLFNTKELEVTDKGAYTEYVPADKSITILRYKDDEDILVRCTHNECEIDIEG